MSAFYKKSIKKNLTLISIISSTRDPRQTRSRLLTLPRIWITGSLERLKARLKCSIWELRRKSRSLTPLNLIALGKECLSLYCTMEFTNSILRGLIILSKADFLTPWISLSLKILLVCLVSFRKSGWERLWWLWRSFPKRRLIGLLRWKINLLIARTEKRS